MDTTKKCEHPGCNCLAQEGSKYCGAYCESNDTPDITCGCGHPSCKVTASH
jgi:hypothetical protein